jgi:hypothetical protein
VLPVAKEGVNSLLRIDREGRINFTAIDQDWDLGLDLEGLCKSLRHEIT